MRRGSNKGMIFIWMDILGMCWFRSSIVLPLYV